MNKWVVIPTGEIDPIQETIVSEKEVIIKQDRVEIKEDFMREDIKDNIQGLVLEKGDKKEGIIIQEVDLTIKENIMRKKSIKIVQGHAMSKRKGIKMKKNKNLADIPAKKKISLKRKVTKIIKKIKIITQTITKKMTHIKITQIKNNPTPKTVLKMQVNE